ncbi:MAG: xanthine dehydrogenase accessory protein XdhC [Hyphomicrobiaceae bacterium]
MTVRGALSDVLERAGTGEPLVRLAVVTTKGSAPRDHGTTMLVGPNWSSGTIGGGQLEFEAIAHARKLLTNAENFPGDWIRDLLTWPLGPALGQCCGGTVRVLFERFGVREFDQIATLATDLDDGDSVLLRPTQSGEPPSVLKTCRALHALPAPVARLVDDMLSGRRSIEATFVSHAENEPPYFIEPYLLRRPPLFIYGAGHVGQAIVKIAADLAFDIHWVDTHAERFPGEMPANVLRVIARDPALIANAAPDDAFHLVLTYSHALDLAICHALLARSRFRFLGLIGSETKRARFHKRLREGGVKPAALNELACPIGIGSLRGKEPATIAVSVVAQLIERLEESREAGGPTAEEEHGASQRLSA